MSDDYTITMHLKLGETPAGRLQTVMELLRGPANVDDEGNVIGYGPPLIDMETARRLLGFE